MILRRYDPDKDEQAAHRIWREVGWIEPGKEQEQIMDLYLSCSRATVAEVHGEAECLVLSTPGTVCYLDQELVLNALTGVTTSRVARKQGLASRLVARVLAEEAATGAHVAGLGMFEQGYYDQLGFGTGGYEHWIGLDPALLKVRTKARIPRRMGMDDWASLHTARLARKRGHGACNLLPAEITRADMLWSKGFGLGYRDGPGDTLSHFIWAKPKGELGPYSIECLAYRTDEQFLELLALIKSLGDQVRLVRMREPPGIQMQDLLRQPFKQRQISAKSDFAAGIRASAYWQMRICDLFACLERTHLWGDDLRFSLKLRDPVERFLGEDAPWRGVGGDYVVTLGAQSAVERGTDQTLPTLAASVNAFTRLWLGVRPASGLAITDELSGPRDLLDRLDRILRLPEPKPDWDY